jgi:hypothetical protein
VGLGDRQVVLGGDDGLSLELTQDAAVSIVEELVPGETSDASGVYSKRSWSSLARVMQIEAFYPS